MFEDSQDRLNVEWKCFYPLKNIWKKRTFVFPYLHQIKIRAFSLDVTAAMLVFQNKGATAFLVYQSCPPWIERYFYPNIAFCFMKTFCCLFERLLSVKFNGFLIFGTSFFVFEILTCLYYANCQHGDVILLTI